MGNEFSKLVVVHDSAYIIGVAETEVLLIRHAQSTGNVEGRFGGHSDMSLSPEGQLQAVRLAGYVRGQGPVAAIYSSDLVRAQQTAQPIAEQTGAQVVVDVALRERSVGRFTGLTFDEARLQFPEDFARLMARRADSSPPGGETAIVCQTRAAEHLTKILAEHPGQRIVIISHAFTINLLLFWIFKIPFAQLNEIFWRTDNAAIHHLRVNQKGMWTVHALNSRTHLT